VKRLAYLGPPGTFSEQAALRWDPKAKLLPFPTFAAVASAVESGMADEGVVAIENSLQGSVTDTLDVLIHETELKIRGEVVVPVEHCLVARPGMAADEIQVIYAHPQSLGQSRKFIERCFPKVQVEAALSNSNAVEQALATEGAAAIGTRRAAQIYGAAILAEGIQDARTNATRFAILGPTDAPPSGSDRTSMALVTDDVPGALVKVLLEFANRGVNLSKIESRPAKDLHALGPYIFLLDLEGHREDPPVNDALVAIRPFTRLMKVFGSYPRAPEAGGSPAA